MITPTYAPTATERVLPSLSIDFTKGVLDARISISRALNTATQYNSGGIIVGVNADLPRFDYNPTTLAARGLLIEETRINAFSYSDQFNNAYWTKSTSTISADAAVSPDGSTTADKLIPNNGGSGGVARQISLTASTAYSVSIFGKASEFSALRILVNNGANFGYVDYNLSAGTASAVAGSLTSTSATITALPNSWYRCTFTFTAVNTATSTHSFQCIATGNGTSGFFIWGAQHETGAFPTSYIPTTTTTATRNADVATMTGSNFSSWYSAGAGSFQANATPRTATGTCPIVQVDDTTANNLISLRQNVAASELYVVSGGADQAQINAGNITANTAYKLTGAWATNNCAAALNGGAAGTDLSVTLPSPTQLRLGSDGTNYGNLWLAKLNYWPQRITNAETQAFSK